MPASSTVANVATPARRAVSPIGPEAGCLLNNNAKRPTTKEYALRPSANMSAQLPIVDIAGTPQYLYRIFSEKRVVCNPAYAEAQFVCLRSAIVVSRGRGINTHCHPERSEGPTVLDSR